MVKYSIEVKNAQQVIANLHNVESRMGDLTKPLKKGGLVMLRSVNLNFDRSGRPITWNPLKISTLRQKLRQGYSSKPLIRTGKMRRSISQQVDSNILKIGTAIPYAQHHHFGTRFMAKRRFLMFQEKDVENINTLVLSYITGKDA